VTRVPIDEVVSQIKKGLRRGDTVRSVPMIRQFVQQAGMDPRARLLQGMLAIEFDQAGEAIKLLEPLTFELMGDDQRLATVLLARARLMSGDAEGALLTIEPVCEVDDAPGTALGVKAEALTEVGRLDEAAGVLDAAPGDIAESHGVALARARLAFATAPDDPELAAREDAAIAALDAEREHVGTPGAALAEVCLALAELNARRGEDAAAGALFKRSCGLNPTQVDARPYAQTVMKLVKSWDGPALSKAQRNQHEPGASTERPIFIVGMPGGGPELAGALLGLHGDVRLNGQPEALTQTVARHLVAKGHQGHPIVFDPPRLSGKALAGAAEWYLQRTDPDDEQPARTVDAFPLNLHVLGVVAQVFPRSRVVFVRRDPFDACLACTTRHRDPRLLYANDPRSVAVFAGGLRRLEDLWSGVFSSDALGMKTLTLDYADLAGGEQGGIAAARSLFEFAGLEAPSDDELRGVIASHTRWTVHGTGLEARFGGRMPELVEAVKQAEIGSV